MLVMPTIYYAFAVDIHGVVDAHYTLAAKDPEQANEEARRHLAKHDVIEVWTDDRRRIGRLVREQGKVRVACRGLSFPLSSGQASRVHFQERLPWRQVL
jgi:hypothetical protein